ncbi:MAG: hypothetical protein ACI37S_03510 [Candidatus Gastranaerophilaceae bacterium]
MNKQFDYNEFKRCLIEQKTENFINLKNDIKLIEGFIENTLNASFESTQSTVERDFNVMTLL